MDEPPAETPVLSYVGPNGSGVLPLTLGMILLAVAGLPAAFIVLLICLGMTMGILFDMADRSLHHLMVALELPMLAAALYGMAVAIVLFPLCI